MRIVLDEEEVLAACTEWLQTHHGLDVSGSPSCGVKVVNHGSDVYQVSVVFDTEKEGLRSHPYR